jgi:hypothetical protein
MTMRAAAVSLAAAFAAMLTGCSETKTGLRVSIDPAEFTYAKSMRVAISAEGGFKAQANENMGGALVTTEDFDGDGALDLIARFNGTFPGTLSFRVDTDNKQALAVRVTALAYDDMSLIAGAEAASSLPAGSEAVVSLRLTGRTGPVGPDTRTTDLKTAAADVTIKGRRVNAHLGPIAVCDANGDGKQDLVLGAPDDDDDRNLGAVGSVSIVFGGGDSATIELANTAIGQATQVFGLMGGDHLGYAVACAELNGDTFDDVVVGAPGAGNGTGRVYVIYGRTGLATNTISLMAASPMDGASVTFASALAGARLGSALFAGDLGGGSGPGPGRVMMAAPGPNARRVHLFANLPAQGVAQAIDVDAATPPHVMFQGVSATAIASGDLDGAGAQDVVLADRNFVPAGTIRARGVVYVLPGVNPASAATIDIATTSPLLTLSGAADGSLLGSAVLVANTAGRGGDLFVSAPGDGGDAGAVYIYQHETDFFGSPTRDSADGGTLIGPTIAGQFGYALAASGVAGSARLLIGAPATGRGDRSQAGAAYVYAGDQNRQFRLVDQVFGAAAQDHLGTFIAGGRIDADQIGDLVTSAPDATGSDSGSGVTYVRFGRAPGAN